VTFGKDRIDHLPQLADFAGRWWVARRIEDHLAGALGRFDGEAVFAPEGGGLRYREEGQLRLGEGPAFAAERSYFWRQAGQRIAVDFADGRPFHDFDPANPAAQHLCVADDYAVRYDFSAWPNWRADWTVTGPRKRYSMISRYSPVSAGSNG
jgi:hypothetical protein